jgi:endoglucanase
VASGTAAQATGASSGASTTVPTTTGNQTTYAGINIAGFDFGCGTDGTCTVVCVFPVLLGFSVIDDNGVADMALLAC